MSPHCHRTVVVLFALVALIVPASVHAAMSIYMTPEDLAARASRIVEATVADSRSGLDPETGRLSTYVTLDVTRVHRGPGRTSRLILREPGGQVGDLVHEVDAVPVYVPGERVFVFLEAGVDGALRTSGMFFGKFTLDDVSNSAVRDLEGQGRILRRPATRERLSRRDLIAVAATVDPQDAQASPGRTAPAELERLTFNDVLDETPKFALSPTHPTRWDQTDSGAPVVFDIERAGNPLGSGAAAVFAIERAMASWTEVPESRVSLATGNTYAQFTPAHPTSPSVSPPAGANIILFGDPYDDIANSGSCSGIVAIGGYWRSSTPSNTVNGITFYAAQYGYVIFNDGLECFLGDPDNLAEVAAHELGHTLGFAHSTAPNSIMRASAYGGRGPELGDDDRDAAHCHYPHTVTVTGPSGAVSWEGGSIRSILWNTSPEAGPDPGTVDLEYQIDDGPWLPVAAGVANDGFHTWVVPEIETDNARVRVARPNRTEGLPSVYPEACSDGVSPEPFGIVALPPVPGEIAVEGPGSGLVIDKASGDQLRMSWSPSCSVETDNYAIYHADLNALGGRFNPQPLTCDTGPDLVEYVTPPAGNRFFLIAPLAGGFEGGYGRGSNGPRNDPLDNCGTAPGLDYCD